MECPFAISDDNTTQLPIINLLINLRRIVNPMHRLKQIQYRTVCTTPNVGTHDILFLL